MRGRRYHTGGLVGLKPGEVAAVLKSGRCYIGLHATYASGPRLLSDRLVNLTISCDPSRAVEAFSLASKALAETALLMETRRMERRILNLYEARL